MYTQCPECETAFRVTADVLKQASGKVRCGGCGNAFNALEFLSEDKPGIRSQPQPETEVPDLAAETAQEAGAAPGPVSMSAAQSAALLKTLDELAGSDIRIEDTGVEWRVLDGEEFEEANESDPESASATGSMKWFLEEEDDDDAEAGVMAGVFDGPRKIELDAELSADDREAVLDELLEETPTPVDQFLTDAPNDIEAGEIFESAPEPEAVRTSIDELRFDDDTPLPDDFDFGGEVTGAMPVEDFAAETADGPVAEIEEPGRLHVDLELGEEDDWQSLLDEVAVGDVEEEKISADDVAESVYEAEPAEEISVDAATSGETEAVSEGESLPDVDTQFAIQAEAMGIDLTGARKTIENIDATAEAEASAIETMAEELAAAEAAIQASTSGEHETLDSDDSADMREVETSASGEHETLDIDDSGGHETLDIDDSADMREVEASASGEHETIDVDETDSPAAAADDEFEIPPLTEEEQTINMQIDQDLMAMAEEDEDGFASTIVRGSFEEIVEEERRAEQARLKQTFDDAPIVETIVMEGDWVQTELERERLAADAAATVDVADLGLREEVRASSDTPIRGGRRKTDPPSWGMIAAAAALGVLLLLQIVHQSRDELATVGFFNATAGPVYRLLGRPLQPSWDVSGWRFEKRRDVLGEQNESLTIFSTLGNKSDEALPYPLISVALTDRFEETIGNKVFEPNEYLASGEDPRQLVTAGKTFEAELTIGALAANATGYKLNVCYHVDGDRLRCGIEDFR